MRLQATYVGTVQLYQNQASVKGNCKKDNQNFRYKSLNPDPLGAI